MQIENEAPLQIEPVIAAPSAAKNPDRCFLCNVRQREKEAILAADEVYALGWSIPRTDEEQERLIRYAVAKRARHFDE